MLTDLLIALDCSRSMLATDLFPDRLRLARRKALDLLRLAPELRVALLPFAGTAALRCPLTGDHLAVAALLDDCDPELFPADAGLQGTAIGGAVRSGLDVSPVITHRFPISDYRDGFAAMLAGQSGKVLLNW